MKKATSASQRVKQQRDARQKAGWQEVRVWVPTKEAAQKVQELASSLRESAFNQEMLEQLKGVQLMSVEMRERIFRAIKRQGSAEYATPSGAFLDLLTELAKTGAIQDMEMAFSVYEKANPSNAHFIAKSVPAKMVNHYFIPILGLNGATKFMQWSEIHASWANELVEGIVGGSFSNVVEAMLESMMSLRKPN